MNSGSGFDRLDKDRVLLVSFLPFFLDEIVMSNTEITYSRDYFRVVFVFCTLNQGILLILQLLGNNSTLDCDYLSVFLKLRAQH